MLMRSLKEDDIRRDFREGVFLECGIGETNGTEKMRMIGDMRARCTIMRVEKIIRDHERDNAAFAYCVKRLRNKIIMNSKFLKAFVDDRCGWVKMFRNLSGDGIQFNACHIDLSSKRGRHQSNKVTGADSGLQDTSTLESEPSKRCIDRFYNRLRGIVRILR